MEVANCQISNTDNRQFELKVRIMKELNLCPQRLSYEEIKSYAHLRDKKCILSYTGIVKPRVLIGQDHYHLIAPMEILKGKANQPYASKTLLGWCVHGLVPREHETDSKRLNVYQLTYDEMLHAEVKNAFALEAIGETSQPRKNPEHERAVSILDITANLKNDLWEVGLAWKSDIKLPESYINAYRRLRSVEFKNINSDLIMAAEVLLIKHSQSQTFINEITCLAQEKLIERNSRLRTLTPYLDKENGLLRVDGRIDAAKDIEREVKTPVILDGRNYITRLIVDNYHKEAARGFNELVVNQIKQRFWVINLRPTVRTVSSRCRACRIRRAKPLPPRLSDLPEARLAHHQRPFSHCGVDLFGPMEITVGRRRERRYGVLFTCMTVRAVHIELAASLTTDSFIMALRRMASRRGWPQHMYSDNGTNLRGAETELRKSFQELNHEYIQEGLSIHGVAWNFSSPSSPHKGGAWERMIQTVKKALKIVLIERAPHAETLLTLLMEVENLVNSRPLTHVSVECTEESLTPNHFLIGSSCNLPIPGIFTDGDLYLRKMWRKAQKLTDMFWKRWVKEVLPTMLPRSKWYEDERNLKIGECVVIVDPDNPRGVWPRGRIIRVFPGGDGRVRTVEVQTKTGRLTRPVTKLAPLPVNDEC